MDERQILDDLERQSTRGYDTSQSDILNTEVVMDLSDVRENSTWAEGKYPFRIMDVGYKMSKERIDERTGQPAGGQPYLLLALFCFAGPCAGEEMDDRVMLTGKALSRFLNLIKACGLYDETSKAFKGRYSDLINCEVWGTVVNREETYKGEKRTRSGIAFSGYEPITKYEVPQEDDPFAEAGVVSTLTETARPPLKPEPELVEVSAAELEPVSDPDPEGPFADEEVAEEVPPQPVAAAARPTARPTARAAGDKPPF